MDSSVGYKMFLLWFVISVTEGTGSATFTKTKIIDDTCATINGVKKDSALTEYDCAITCLEDVGCRRFLFCSSTSLCNIFVHGTDCIVDGDASDCSCFRKNYGCVGTDCTCPLGYYGNKCQNVITDCSEAEKHDISYTYSVLIYVKPSPFLEPFEILCNTNSGGWATILDRASYCKPENFNRSLAEYVVGFGNAPKNRWIGFENVAHLLNVINNGFTLNVIIITKDLIPCQAHYTGFSLGTSSSGFKFEAQGYSGTCGDAMKGNVGEPFSTYDLDFSGNNECVKRFGGGWWFSSNGDDNCTRSFLTGTIDGSGTDNFWYDDLGESTGFHRVQLRLNKNIVQAVA